MHIKRFAGLLVVIFCQQAFSQSFSPISNPLQKAWCDSVYATLNNDERIAQLMVVRLSSINSKTKQVSFFENQVDSLINQYNIGGICVFQGSPVHQAEIINRLQAKARTPILMCIDAEWGVGMRMTDSVLPLPRQMMLGAMKDASIVYQFGKLVGQQCKRVGIQVNYAPVVDVNNNPNNPVINDRSFGEDKYKVAQYGIEYMKGMQDMGVMACAKHFPGHGDVSVDSHFDLPVINKTMDQLDSLELYPFKQIFNAGVGSVMLAHLFIPAIDSTSNRATSLSPKNINELLRGTIGFKGLTFTDALEMQGVKKFFPNGEASVQSIIAGNDMLCLPGDVPLAISKIKEAIAENKITWADIELHCKKVLLAKYQCGLNHLQPINTNNLTNDLNATLPTMRRKIAENAITLASKTDEAFFPLYPWNNSKPGDIAFVSIGSKTETALSNRMVADYNANVFFADSLVKNSEDVASFVDSLNKHYKKVVIGIQNLGRSPASNFGLSPLSISITNELLLHTRSILLQFGNPYAAKNWCDAKNLVVCYEDDDIIEQTATDMLQGKLPYKGVLPVTVCDQLTLGKGTDNSLPTSATNQWGINRSFAGKIDSIANDAIAKKATPACAVLVLKDGKIAFQKAYGTYSYDDNAPITNESVFDLASVTKICATTLSVMKLYDEGRLDLNKTLGDYLPFVKGSNKAHLSIKKLLLHQAGLVPYIPFYKETIDEQGKPLAQMYSEDKRDSFSIKVANHMYLENSWADSIQARILKSPLGPEDKYVYSDNDFIFLCKIVEQLSRMPLDAYVRKTFYDPMGLSFIGFNPLQRHASSLIVPTEEEAKFRMQLLRGYVHDPGAAMMGGVSGHAGLFSNAYDLAAIMQMLLNGGSYNGKHYLKEETVSFFTGYQSQISRRGYGFDKPEKDNATRKEPYPFLSASANTFGHTGFTGTCVWADPAKKLVYVFLSNRVNPIGSDTLLKMNVRPKIQEAIYQAFSTQ